MVIFPLLKGVILPMQCRMGTPRALSVAKRGMHGPARADCTKALVVNPASDGVRCCYARYGFAPIPGTQRVCLPLKLLQRRIAKPALHAGCPEIGRGMRKGHPFRVTQRMVSALCPRDTSRSSAASMRWNWSAVPTSKTFCPGVFQARPWRGLAGEEGANVALIGWPNSATALVWQWSCLYCPHVCVRSEL